MLFSNAKLKYKLNLKCKPLLLKLLLKLVLRRRKRSDCGVSNETLGILKIYKHMLWWLFKTFLFCVCVRSNSKFSKSTGDGANKHSCGVFIFNDSMRHESMRCLSCVHYLLINEFNNSCQKIYIKYEQKKVAYSPSPPPHSLRRIQT